MLGAIERDEEGAAEVELLGKSDLFPRNCMDGFLPEDKLLIEPEEEEEEEEVEQGERLVGLDIPRKA